MGVGRSSVSSHWRCQGCARWPMSEPWSGRRRRGAALELALGHGTQPVGGEGQAAVRFHPSSSGVGGRIDCPGVTPRRGVEMVSIPGSCGDAVWTRAGRASRSMAGRVRLPIRVLRSLSDVGVSGRSSVRPFDELPGLCGERWPTTRGLTYGSSDGRTVGRRTGKRADGRVGACRARRMS